MRALAQKKDDSKDIYITGTKYRESGGEMHYVLYFYTRNSAHMIMNAMADHAENPDFAMPPQAHDILVQGVSEALHGPTFQTK
jgi:hypothetical protein